MTAYQVLLVASLVVVVGGLLWVWAVPAKTPPKETPPKEGLDRREAVGAIGLGIALLFRVGRGLSQVPAEPGQVPSGLTITTRPMTMAFRPQRLVIPATVAPYFTILDIRVGNVSQFAGSGGIPAEVFAPTQMDMDLMMDPAGPTQEICVTIARTNHKPHEQVEFVGAFLGKSVDETDGRRRMMVLPISSGARFVS